ncbi:hypothetical protein MXB_4475 [Myxobolus squamalis]|nr:hypothetical protein MXB_4475 [Myxobolus squamalis]
MESSTDNLIDFESVINPDHHIKISIACIIVGLIFAFVWSTKLNAKLNSFSRILFFIQSAIASIFLGFGFCFFLLGFGVNL